VLLREDEGLNTECVATFDNIQPIRRSFLTDRIGACPRVGVRSAALCPPWPTADGAIITLAALAMAEWPGYA
jgi:hypothetical protein